MKNILILTIILFGINSSKAQQGDKELIKAVIDQFFTGMKNKDTTLIMKSLTRECRLDMVLGRELDNPIKNEPIDQFLEKITKIGEAELDERLLSYSIEIDSKLASAWTPYQFYFNKKFNHCGANLFTLVKIRNQWKITSIIDTRRKENCN